MKHWASDDLRAMVDARAGGMCERCGGPLDSFFFSRHHRQPRGRFGVRGDPPASSIVVLCGSGTTGCHGWVESHRADARVMGWLLRGEDPETIPVPYRGHWALLDNNGLITFLPFAETIYLPPPRGTHK